MDKIRFRSAAETAAYKASIAHNRQIRIKMNIFFTYPHIYKGENDFR